jgi:putative flavoprotein involved in K+ transport
VIIATGPHGVPHVPAGLDATEVLTANSYRNPDQLMPGGVLVVGASSSGVQIADELNRAGREVLLSAGRHTRMPRRYRGTDIFWWLHVTGRLARTIHEVPDPSAARREPSMQLVGRAPEHDVDLVALQARGVRLLGRFDGMQGARARFRPDLAQNVAAADNRMHRVLDAVDEYVARTGLTDEVLPTHRPRRLDLPAPTGSVNLSREGIGTVLVAAGYRPDYPWLRLRITAPDGSIWQNQGVTPASGVYVVGQRFQHRRDSGFIDGARHDARTVVRHLQTGSTSIASSECSEESAA